LAAETETKAEAFVRIATKRMNKATKALRILENLGSYPHTAEQTNHIVNALKKSVEQVEYSLGGDEKKPTEEFSFDEEI
jgi:hypothetical protein